MPAPSLALLFITVTLLSNFSFSAAKCPAKGQTYRLTCIDTSLSCDNPVSSGRICDVIGCFCPYGKVLDEKVNACVNASDCCKLNVFFVYNICDLVRQKGT